MFHSNQSLSERLQRHVGGELMRLPVLKQQFETYELPNLHLALKGLFARDSVEAESLGVIPSHEHEAVSLARLANPVTAAHYVEGPIEYQEVSLAGGRTESCVTHALHLLRIDGRPLLLLFRAAGYMPREKLVAEVVSVDRDRSQDFLRTLAAETHRGPAFRGHVLSLESDCFRSVGVHFHSLPRVSREHIVLPEEVLDRIDRHTLRFSKNAESLRAAGRHLKRGILLHGPPGTGKTLTAKYLAAQMGGRTVILATGAGMGMLEVACRLARQLEPATIIIEDVDLIGTQRQHQTVGANSLLFELLNQMDGLADDVDLLFILTTNRPDILEPALAARPGRIDQAIEIPLPDSECRRRLIDLYSQGLVVRANNLDRIIDATEGASGAFIRELMRKAAVIAVEQNERDGRLSIDDGCLHEALDELLLAGGPLTQSLLGAKIRTADE